MNKRLKKIIDENDFTKKFNIDEAVDLAINTATTKFDETIDICMNLNIDSKNGEQNVRGTITLPKGLGKKVKVCVFAKEDKQQEAKKEHKKTRTILGAGLVLLTAITTSFCHYQHGRPDTDWND